MSINVVSTGRSDPTLLSLQSVSMTTFLQQKDLPTETTNDTRENDSLFRRKVFTRMDEHKAKHGRALSLATRLFAAPARAVRRSAVSDG